jgi:signal transduction histidine kinase
MRRGRHILRSTPFRFAVTFTALFVVVFVLSGAIVYQVMSGEMSERLDETVWQTFTVIAASYGDNEMEDLVAAVESHAAATDQDDQIVALTDTSGERLAGNFAPGKFADGFSSLTGQELGLPNAESYRVLSGKVGSNRLTVGISHDEMDELKTVVLNGFGWGTGIAALLAMTAGALLAARVQRRLDAIASTMVEVSTGRLDARIPLIGNGDDIDGVSGQVNAALHRLASLVEGMRQVSNDIAHDLKTPLNRLHIILESAAGKAGDPSLAAELAEATVEMEGINATFDALLRIAQIEAGARKARFKPVEVGDILEAIADAYTEVAADDGKTLSLTARTSDACMVNGDADLLTQLFANLVENALRHCPSGTSIALSVAAHGDRIVAEARDDGPGIPIEEREKVFRRLYRMDKSRTTPGSGLGLSLASAIADLHGAGISLEDGAPGLRVLVSFPRLGTT